MCIRDRIKILAEAGLHRRNMLIVAISIGMGLGVAAVPGLSIPREANSTVIGVPLVDPVVNRTLGLISRHQHAMPPASRTLFDMLVAGLGKPRRRPHP